MDNIANSDEIILIGNVANVTNKENIVANTHSNGKVCIKGYKNWIPIN